MAAFIPKLSNQSMLIFGFILADILPYVKDAAFFYALIGAFGALFGQIIYIAKRDRDDIENKYKFLYWRDALFTIGWMAVGGFFPLVASLPDVPEKILFMPTPVIPIAVSPFISSLWDVMEKELPLKLTRYLDRLDEKKKSQEEKALEESKETKK